MKLYLPNKKDCVRLTAPWIIDSYEIAYLMKSQNLSSYVSGTVCTIPVGTTIQFISMYKFASNECSINIRDGIFKKMLSTVEVSIEKLNDIEFEIIDNQKKEVKKVSLISWMWERTAKPGTTIKIGPLSKINKVSDNVVSYIMGDALGYYGRTTKMPFAAHIKVYAYYETYETAEYNGLVKNSKLKFTLKEYEYEVYSTKTKEIIGTYKSQEQVRNAVNKYIEQNDKSIWL